MARFTWRHIYVFDLPPSLIFVTDTDSLLCELRADDEEIILVIEAVLSVTYELSLQKQFSFYYKAWCTANIEYRQLNLPAKDTFVIDWKYIVKIQRNQVVCVRVLNVYLENIHELNIFGT